MSDEMHAGGCPCGSVRFEVAGAPKTTLFCHCKFCQSRTGGLHALLVYFRKDAVISLTGALKKNRQQSDESGRWIETECCEKCGASVTWTLELVPSWRGFEGSTFDGGKVFPCQIHQWTDSAAPSDHIDPKHVRFPRQAPFTTEQLEKL